MGLPREVLRRVERQNREYPGSPEFWEEVRAELDAGLHPHDVALSKALHSGNSVPAWAADYIATRYVDEPSLFRKGERPWSTVGLNFREVSRLIRENDMIRQLRQIPSRVYAREVLRREREYESAEYAEERLREHRRKYGARTFPPKEPSAFVKALEEVSDETGVSVRTLREYVKRL